MAAIQAGDFGVMQKGEEKMNKFKLIDIPKFNKAIEPILTEEKIKSAIKLHSVFQIFIGLSIAMSLFFLKSSLNTNIPKLIFYCFIVSASIELIITISAAIGLLTRKDWGRKLSMLNIVLLTIKQIIGFFDKNFPILFLFFLIIFSIAIATGFVSFLILPKVKQLFTKVTNKT